MEHSRFNSEFEKKMVFLMMYIIWSIKMTKHNAVFIFHELGFTDCYRELQYHFSTISISLLSPFD